MRWDGSPRPKKQWKTRCAPARRTAWWMTATALYGGGRFILPERRLAAPGAVDLSPPPPDLTPPLGDAGMCLFRGVAECALSGARRLP
jgi:hypothetical protein